MDWKLGNLLVKLRTYAKENNIIVSQQESGASAEKKIGGFGKGLANFIFYSRVGEKEK